MASKRRLRRQAERKIYKQCGKKQSYSSLGDAIKASKLARARTNHSIYAYICDHCSQYHIGHSARPKYYDPINSKLRQLRR